MKYLLNENYKTTNTYKILTRHITTALGTEPYLLDNTLLQTCIAGTPWCIPVIPTTWEAEARGSQSDPASKIKA
jgi:hypothetical protein